MERRGSKMQSLKRMELFSPLKNRLKTIFIATSFTLNHSPHKMLSHFNKSSEWTCSGLVSIVAHSCGMTLRGQIVAIFYFEESAKFSEKVAKNSVHALRWLACDATSYFGFAVFLGDLPPKKSPITPNTQSGPLHHKRC